MAKRTHKDVEYAVDNLSGKEHIFKTFDEAAPFALNMAIAGGVKVNLDVLVYSRAGARFVGGDSSVEQYDEDPAASVFERITIKAEPKGRVA